MREVGRIEIIADSQDAGAFTAYPDALRFIIAVRGRRDPCRRGLLLQECGPLPAPDPPGHLRRRERSGVRPGDAGTHPPGVFDADISGRDFAQGKPHPEIFLAGADELGVPPEECFVVEDAVSGIQAAKAGRMAALVLSRAHDEDLLGAAEPDVLVAPPWMTSTSTRWPKAGWRRGAPDRRRHARRGEIAKDDVRVVAARAGCELELYLGRCLLLVDVRHPSPKVTVLPRLSNSWFRVNARHLSGWSCGADRRLRGYSSLPNGCAFAAMARGIDRPIRWSLRKVADLKVSS